MRFTFIFILSLLTLLSCQDIAVFESQDTLKARATVDSDGDNISISNPTLINNWENVTVIRLNTEGDTNSHRVTSPWTEGSSGPLSADFRNDIKSEDGWKMLFHTFKEIGLDKKQNYMCFYNMFTGYLKVFYYYEGENTYQGTQWYVKVSNDQNSGIFNLVDYISKPNSECPNNEIQLSNMAYLGPTTGLVPGWNGFEFEVPYCTDYKNLTFQIGAYDKKIESFHFEGKENSMAVGTITSKKEEVPSIVNGIANIVGGEAKKVIDNIVDSAHLGTKLTSLITNISSGGYVSAIKAGLKLIFGKTTIVSEDIKLTTTSSIVMSGTASSVETVGIPVLNFNFYNTMNPTTTNDIASSSRSYIYNTSDTNDVHYLGVWSMSTPPSIVHRRLTPLTNIEVLNINTSNNKRYVKGTTNYPTIYKYPSFIFNPDLEQYVVDRTSNIELIRCDSLNGEKFKPGTSDIWEKIGTPILYKDSLNTFYTVGRDDTVTKEGYVDNDREIHNYHYDWGLVTYGKLFAVVTVSTTYSYIGKTIVVDQSRVYEPHYDFDVIYVEEYEYNNSYSDAIINYGYPYFGDLIEEDDLYLYGKD